ncbi:MAG: protein O-GlcNAc transferase [Candidatus Marinamargulisbacteria bacterium]|jgi:protein O-GlcNAc transferase
MNKPNPITKLSHDSAPEMNTAGDAKISFDVGRDYVEQGRYLKAKGIFEKLLEIEPENVDFKIWFGRACLNLGNKYKAQYKFWKAKKEFEISIALADKILVDDPSSAPALTNLALTFFNQGKMDVAVAKLSLAVEKDHHYPDAYFHLGSCYLMKGESDDSYQNFKQAAFLFLEQGETKKCIPIFKQMLEKTPHSLDILKPLGTAYFKEGQLNQCIHILTKALRIDPDNSEILDCLGQAYLGQKNIAKAMEMFVKEGLAHYRNGKAQTAFKFFAKALEVGNVS